MVHLREEKKKRLLMLSTLLALSVLGLQLLVQSTDAARATDAPHASEQDSRNQ